MKIALLLFSDAEADSMGLARVQWEHRADLERLQDAALDIRYCGEGFVLISGDVGHLRATGWTVEVLDARERTGQYCIAWSLEDTRLAVPLLRDGDMTILWTEERQVDALRRYSAFLMELPHWISLEGWLPQAGIDKPVATPEASPLVDALVQDVRADRMERDLAQLVYLDPTRPYDNALSNLRTRFARHPDTRDSAAAYIVEQLADALGPEAVTLEPFRRTPDDSTMYNVVGTLGGTSPDAGYYILCGHYDSIVTHGLNWNWRTDPAPGADDNGTGTVCVLEAARALSGLTFPWSIKFILFSGEELGLWGSRAYAMRGVEQGDRILGVLNLDMVGYNRLHDRLVVLANPASTWMLDRTIMLNERYEIGLRLDPIVDAREIRSDHGSFWLRGYDAITAIESYPPERNEIAPDSTVIYRAAVQMHSVEDVMDSLNFSQIRKTAQLFVAYLAEFAYENKVQEAVPDLALLAGDVRIDADEEQLVVAAMNLNNAAIPDTIEVRVWACEKDSTECEEIWIEKTIAIPPGGSYEVRVPWTKLGEAVVRAEIDPANRIAEMDETNNAIYASLRHVPLSRLVVYPNPFRIGGTPGHVAFAGMPDDASVQIFSPSGEQIWQDTEERREVLWYGQNEAGFLLGSGIYFYTIVDPEGRRTQTGKLAVLR